jgi:hypothetical protein
MPRTRRAYAGPLAACVLSGAALGFAAPHYFPDVEWTSVAPPAPASVVAHGSDAAARLAGAAFGKSGQLRVVVADPYRRVEMPMEWTPSTPQGVTYRWVPQHGTQTVGLIGGNWLSAGLNAPSRQGVYRLQLSGPGFTQDVDEVSLITRIPFSEKRGAFLNGYRIGFYATEFEGRTDRYAPPAGFIEVTPENQELHVSTHFRLRNFLTKDQFSVWPKYLALDLRLIDKLELVMQELNAMGVRAENMAVMSGFRTPAYNGPGEGGRAKLSRHTYGDASDVWVDNDRDGYMDDLNGDGRRDTGDAQVMLRAVDRVERRFPELTGGAGVYRDNGAHGPFIHIDARGYRSRW